MSQQRARKRKLPVFDDMTHMIEIDIVTGHEEIGNLHFFPEALFSLHIYRKNMHFLKTCSQILKV